MFNNFKMLAAALVMAAGMYCAGPQQASQTTTQPPAQTVSSPPAHVAAAAPAAKTSAIDELDAAIRDASDYLNEKVPQGNKIVILNVQSASTDLSDYIIDELIANAVNDGIFTVVDRQQLDAIREEQQFQMSGAVDDKDAQAIGKFFGAQTVVSGAVNKLGATGYRIRIRALEVQTAQVQGQYNRNITESAIVNSLMESGGSTSRTINQAQVTKPAQESKAITDGSGFKDSRDGKSYRVIKIDGQTWMAENLNYKTKNSKCYGNDASNCAKYGRLYNWDDAKNACPIGWHLPLDAEWKTLENSVGGSSTAGKKLKSRIGWRDNGNGTDDYGFSALPGGNGDLDGYFYDAGNNGYWWGSTEDGAYGAWRRGMYYNVESVDRYGSGKPYLFSVRCVAD